MLNQLGGLQGLKSGGEPLQVFRHLQHCRDPGSTEAPPKIEAASTKRRAADPSRVRRDCSMATTVSGRPRRHPRRGRESAPPKQGIAARQRNRLADQLRRRRIAQHLPQQTLTGSTTQLF